MSRLERAQDAYQEGGIFNVAEKTVNHYRSLFKRRSRMAYSVIRRPHKLFYSVEDVNILSDRETMQYLKDNDVGISRFGDGELAYLFGGGTSHEKSNSLLSNQIRNILREYNNEIAETDVIVGLPISLTLGDMYEERNGSKEYWQYYKKYSMVPFLGTDVVYASPFCFRLDSIDHSNKEEHLAMIKSLLDEKQIIYVSDGRSLDSIEVNENIKIPSENAFTNRQEIIAEITNKAQLYSNVVVLLSAGVTATCLAYELSRNGIRTYDVGKLYRWL